MRKKAPYLIMAWATCDNGTLMETPEKCITSWLPRLHITSPFLVSEPQQQAPIKMLSLPADTLALLPVFSELHRPEAPLNCLFRPWVFPPPLQVTPLPSSVFPSHFSSLRCIRGGIIAVQSVGKITGGARNERCVQGLFLNYTPLDRAVRWKKIT